MLRQVFLAIGIVLGVHVLRYILPHIVLLLLLLTIDGIWPISNTTYPNVHCVETNIQLGTLLLPLFPELMQTML